MHILDASFHEQTFNARVLQITLQDRLRQREQAVLPGVDSDSKGERSVGGEEQVSATVRSHVQRHYLPS